MNTGPEITVECPFCVRPIDLNNGNTCVCDLRFDVTGNGNHIFPKSIRVLSFREPYASLFLHTGIDIRNIHSNRRNIILVYATKHPHTYDQVVEKSGELFADYIFNTIGKGKPGYIIGKATLVNSRPMRKTDEVKSNIKYTPGLYYHLYKDVTSIKPILHKGKIDFNNLPPYLIQRITEPQNELERTA